MYEQFLFENSLFLNKSKPEMLIIRLTDLNKSLLDKLHGHSQVSKYLRAFIDEHLTYLSS